MLAASNWRGMNAHRNQLEPTPMKKAAAAIKTCPKAAAALRCDLRTAVTNYATDRGALASLIHEIERVAKYLSGNPEEQLGKATKHARALVEANAPHMLTETGLPRWNWHAMYDAVREDRNDLTHTGTAAALTGTRAVALALVLMEALMTPRKCTTAGQLMVSNPVCARSWQTLADVRRTMLMHDYSTPPFENGDSGNGDGWKVLRAQDLGKYLLDDRKHLCQRLEEARELAQPVSIVGPKIPAERFVDYLPVVVAEHGRLLGIVTAFDLL